MSEPPNWEALTENPRLYFGFVLEKLALCLETAATAGDQSRKAIPESLNQFVFPIFPKNKLDLTMAKYLDRLYTWLPETAYLDAEGADSGTVKIMLLAAHYLQTLSKWNDNPIRSDNVHLFFGTASTCAFSYLSEFRLPEQAVTENLIGATVQGRRLDDLQLQFLSALDWRLGASDKHLKDVFEQICAGTYMAKSSPPPSLEVKAPETSGIIGPV